MPEEYSPQHYDPDPYKINTVDQPGDDEDTGFVPIVAVVVSVVLLVVTLLIVVLT